MTGMPQRPRSHVLETVSRDALNAVLPPEWLVRAMEPDYGVDALVEIFQSERATGLTFAVQLRATDEQNLTKALAVRFRREQLAYFAALDVPVLIVRYHAPSGRLFASWFHRFDPNPGTASATLRLSEKDHLTHETAPALAAEVSAVRRFAPSTLDWPVTFSVVADEASDASGADLAAAFGAYTSGLERYVRFRAAPTAGLSPPSIRMATQSTVVDLAVTSVTLHHPTPIDRSQLAAEVVMALAVSLGTIGHVQAAGALATRGAAESTMLLEPEILFRIAGFLHQGRLVGDAIDIDDALAARGEDKPGELMLGMVLMAGGRSLPDADRRRLDEHLRVRVDEAIGEGKLEDAAARAYSLANRLFHIEARYQDALGWYRKALELEPRYSERAYFCGELGAALFESGCYSESAEWYERAVQRGAEPATLARLADATLLSGAYQEAVERFQQYLREEAEPEGVWRLRAATAEWLVSTRGMSHQERDSGAAIELAAVAHEQASVESRRQMAEQALAQDALSGGAWHLIGEDLVNNQGKYAEAVIPLVLSAFGSGEVETWADALVVAAVAGALDLIDPIIDAAARQHHSQFLSAVSTALSQYPADVRNPILAVVQGAVTQIVRNDAAFTVRFHTDRGVEDFVFRPDAAEDDSS